MKKILFICGQNQLRSPTAEQLYAETPSLEVASAGLNHESPVPVSPELLEWADRIFVMESAHRSRLKGRFNSSLQGKKISCLNIPDRYAFMDDQLLAILERKLTPMIGPPSREA